MFKITFDLGKFVRGIPKAAIKAASFKYDEAALLLVEAFGVEPNADEPSRRAAQLLNRATSEALHKVMHSVKNRLRGEHENDEAMIKRLEAAADRLVKTMSDQAKAQGLQLTPDLFDDPAKLPGLTDVEERLKTWLEYVNYPIKPVSVVTERYRGYFIDAFFAELRRKQRDYDSLINYIDSPLKPLWRRHAAWEKYQELCAKRREVNGFLIDFPLHRVFVWPNVYYDNWGVRHVVALRDELDRWLDMLRTLEPEQRSEAFKVLTGDPGSGKSSASREYAYYRATEKNDRVLYVPLHRLVNFWWKQFRDELARYFQDETGEDVDPIADATAGRPVLVILDGLDELSHQGEKGRKAADQFVEEVTATAVGWNTRAIRVAIIFCGRPIPVQEIGHRFRRDRQILHLLPYVVTVDDTDEARKPGVGGSRYSDPFGLLTVGEGKDRQQADLRLRWWELYGEATGRPQPMPKMFAQPDVTEITAQPMMHHLAAVVSSDEAAAKRLCPDGRFRRAVLFRLILEKVHRREWGEPTSTDLATRHHATQSVALDQFRRLMSVLGQAAWHGGAGRVTNIEEFRRLCDEARLGQLLKKYEDEIVGGAVSLFTAFYIRYASVSDTAGAFEFSHKSFGEYLTAVRLVDVADDMSRRLGRPQQTDEEYGPTWTARGLLKEWLTATGPASLTYELFEHVESEVNLRAEEATDFAPKVQKAFVQLMNASLADGLPAHHLTGLSFPRMAEYAAHAEHTLLCILGACTAAAPPLVDWPAPSAGSGNESDDETLSEEAWTPACETERYAVLIDWPSKTAAADLVRRVRFQREHWWKRNEPLPLAYFDFRGQWLQGCDLTAANLFNAILDRAFLVGASLDFANLDQASLCNANLDRASFVGANLNGARLERASLVRANLDRASLIEANLFGANLFGSTLERTRLIGANLEKAILAGAKLDGARLERANLIGVRLDGASLEGVILTEANLDRANMVQAILARAVMDGATLCGARLDGAILNRASLIKANLSGASLSGAILDGANLYRANLNGVSLNGARLNGTSVSGAILNRTILDRATMDGTLLDSPKGLTLLKEKGAII